MAEKLVARVNGLLVVYGGHAPQLVPGTGHTHDWVPFAHGTLARTAHLLGSILLLHEKNREVDARVLARSLFEHVVSLAWIAIDPPEHLPQLIASEYRYRVNSDDEFEAFEGQRMLPATVRAEFEQFRDSHRRAPSVRDLTRAVDAHWAGLLPELDSRGRYSFGAGYTLLYRNFSTYTHPTLMQLNHFVKTGPEVGQCTIGEPGIVDRPTALGVSAGLFAQLLLITSHEWGWPDRDAVHGVYEFFNGDGGD